MNKKEYDAWKEWEKEQDDLDNNDVGIPSQLIALIVIVFGVVVCSFGLALGSRFGMGMFIGGAVLLFLAGINFVDGL